MPTPTEVYLEKVKQYHWQQEPEQLRVLESLDACAAHIMQHHKAGVWQQIKTKLKRHPDTVNVFCWGPVGRGKTMLMDCFFQSLPEGLGRRQHFYQFMLNIRQQLSGLQCKNPLDQVAKTIAQQCKVCCLDEFLVDDIGDAMVLGGLLQALNRQGVSVITNANTPPDKLYEHGIQRQSFLPTIAFIQQHYQVIHCETAVDFRKQASISQTFFEGSPQEQIPFMQQCLQRLSPQQASSETSIQVLDRDIAIHAQAGDVLWIDFEALCLPPRAPMDYLWLCDHYYYVLISGVRPIGRSERDLLSNWIKWIDICYDRQINLILAAQCRLDAIYQPAHASYARCDSRLHEMLQIKQDQ